MGLMVGVDMVRRWENCCILVSLGESETFSSLIVVGWWVGLGAVRMIREGVLFSITASGLI